MGQGTVYGERLGVRRSTVIPSRIHGQKPSVRLHDFKDGRGRVRAHRHPNGGGWVEESAAVEPSVVVYEKASVTGDSVLQGHGVVSDYSRVHNSSAYGYYYLSEDSQITDSRLNGRRGNITVADGSEVEHSLLKGHVVLWDHSRVFRSTVKGRVFVDGGKIEEQHLVSERGQLNVIGQTVEAVKTYPQKRAVNRQTNPKSG